VQSSTLKTAINFMIYGVSVFLNDVNFSLKNREKQVVSRMYYQAFFTNKKTAISMYQHYLKEFNSQKGIVYGNYDLRGKAEVYKATINDSGQIMPHGNNIMEQSANYPYAIHKPNRSPN
jgi:hypothetical protein